LSYVVIVANVRKIINCRMKFNFQLNINSISLSSYQLTAHMLQYIITPTMECFSIYVENYFSASYLSYRIFLLACLSGLSGLVFGFYRSTIATYLKCEMHATDLFLRASRITTSFPRVCTNGVTEWREVVASHLLHTCS